MSRVIPVEEDELPVCTRTNHVHATAMLVACQRVRLGRRICLMW
jgi:hypothetical protein